MASPALQPIIHKLSRELVYGGHLAAIAATGIVLSFVLLFNLTITVQVLLIPYLLCQVIYAFNHLFELRFDTETNPERSEYVQSSSSKLLLFLYSVFLIATLVFTPIPAVILVLITLLGGILYTTHIKTYLSAFFAGLKSVYVSLFWSLPIFFVPLVLGSSVTSSYFYLYAFLFCHEIVNTTFCDIKDIDSDRKRKVHTIPVLFGKEKTLIFLHIINALSLDILLIGYERGALPVLSIFLIAAVVYEAGYLIASTNMREKALRTLTYVAVDGEYLLWPLLILLGRIVLKSDV